jgi:hypothetical protein
MRNESQLQTGPTTWADQSLDVQSVSGQRTPIILEGPKSRSADGYATIKQVLLWKQLKRRCKRGLRNGHLLALTTMVVMVLAYFQVVTIALSSDIGLRPIPGFVKSQAISFGFRYVTPINDTNISTRKFSIAAQPGRRKLLTTRLSQSILSRRIMQVVLSLPPTEAASHSLCNRSIRYWRA